jgi:hypothetical protein
MYFTNVCGINSVGDSIFEIAGSGKITVLQRSFHDWSKREWIVIQLKNPCRKQGFSR